MKKLLNASLVYAMALAPLSIKAESDCLNGMRHQPDNPFGMYSQGFWNNDGTVRVMAGYTGLVTLKLDMMTGWLDAQQVWHQTNWTVTTRSANADFTFGICAGAKQVMASCTAHTTGGTFYGYVYEVA